MKKIREFTWHSLNVDLYYLLLSLFLVLLCRNPDSAVPVKVSHDDVVMVGCKNRDMVKCGRKRENQIRWKKWDSTKIRPQTHELQHNRTSTSSFIMNVYMHGLRFTSLEKKRKMSIFCSVTCKNNSGTIINLNNTEETS